MTNTANFGLGFSGSFLGVISISDLSQQRGTLRFRFTSLHSWSSESLPYPGITLSFSVVSQKWKKMNYSCIQKIHSQWEISSFDVKLTYSLRHRTDAKLNLKSKKIFDYSLEKAVIDSKQILKSITRVFFLWVKNRQIDSQYKVLVYLYCTVFEKSWSQEILLSRPNRWKNLLIYTEVFVGSFYYIPNSCL